MNLMNKTLLLLLPFFFISQLVVAQHKQSEGIKKFDALLQYVERAYVDSVDENKLVEKAIIAVLKELDPHSVYIPQKELKKMNEPLVGNFEGIGIRFNILHDTLTVISPITGGPSEKVGIRSGDKIVEVNGESIAGIGIQNSDVQEKLRGKKGTKVNVGVKRRKVPEMVNFTITRDKIPLFSIDATYMATEDIGYIKLNRFAKKSINEFRTSITQLKEQKMKHLILDLRGNGGGYLRTAIQITDEILNDKRLIVYTEGIKNSKKEFFTTTEGGFEKGKLVILIDEGSASASEIVSGAVQDYDRGLIVGRRSFGKGLVQKPFMLTDGSAIRLTTARYYTPSGRCIQKSYKDGKDNYYNELNRRYENGELMNKDSINLPDSLKFKTLNSGRTVYGGGGIMPDIFVPIDTGRTSDYYTDVVRKGLLNEFSLDYVNSHRDQLNKKYSSVNDFKTNFDIENEVLADFISYAEKNDVAKNEKDINTSKELLTTHLEALIVRSLWDTSAYFQIINELNSSYLKAIESINNNTFKKEKLTNK